MRFLRRVSCAVAVCAFAITSAAGADLKRERLPDDYTDDGKPLWYPWLDPKPIARWEAEVGGRYFFSSGRTKLDLFGFPPDHLVSRLTYSGLSAHSAELFGRVEHATGYFIKGYIGGGAITGGHLKDEDFPPILGGYTSTTSEQHSGRLAYGTVDLGYEWRSERLRLGFFLGYFYNFERVNAFGCAQTAANPFLWVPPIPSSVLLITQKTTWHALRLGFSTDWRFRPGWRVTTDAAWLPYAQLVASDTHWLRIPSSFNGPTPESGSATLNVQLEGTLSYQFSPALSAGIGGRYWHIATSKGQTTAHFEVSAGAELPQGATLSTDRWGGFLQASYKFGDLRSTLMETR